MPESNEVVQSLRRFNRFYTLRIGVLRRGLLGTPYSLTEARVLYELAHRPGLVAAELGQDLELDRGYLSRILGQFERKRLVARRTSKRDGRRQHLRLTAAGRRAFAEMDRRSTDQAARLTGHLGRTEQRRLQGLLGEIQRLLSCGEAKAVPGQVILREPQPGDFGWVVERHGALYAGEYGWDVGFEALVARIVADYAGKHDPAREKAWIAELDGQPVGCVFLVRESDAVAKLRLLLVDPSARGHGLGRRLVDECVGFAERAGYRKIALWTNSVLHAARRIYEASGFRLVREEPHRSFGPDLVGQFWEKELRSAEGQTTSRGPVIRPPAPFPSEC